MIGYIIASVFLFQSVYITGTEHTLSMTGGTEVDIANGKFLVSVWFRPENSRCGDPICNGVIINEWFILTAYTCLSGITRTGSLEVHFGITNRLGKYLYKVASVISDGHSISNIALLRLEIKIRDNIFAMYPPIDLPDYSFTYRADRIVKIMGYEKKNNRWILSEVNTTLIERHDRPRDVIFANNTNYNVANILKIDDIGSPIFLEGTFIGMVSQVHVGNNLIKGINIREKFGFIIDKLG